MVKVMPRLDQLFRELTIMIDQLKVDPATAMDQDFFQTIGVPCGRHRPNRHLKSIRQLAKGMVMGEIHGGLEMAFPDQLAGTLQVKRHRGAGTVEIPCARAASCSAFSARW